MKKYLKPIAIYTGTFIVLNIGMFFLIKMTQPKSEVLNSAIQSDTSAVVQTDSLSHGDNPEFDQSSSDSTLNNESMLGALRDSASASHSGQTADQSSEMVGTLKESTQAAAIETSPHTNSNDSDTRLTGTEPFAADEGELAVDAEGDVTLSETPKSTAEITKLAKLLEGMKPDEAAVIAERLPTETIVQLVMRMKSRSGAKMMASLPVPVAASVATRMAELSGVKSPS